MPKIVNHDEYRRKILAKSFNLFTRKGYNNITMDEIAKEIGASKGILYHYFPSKEKILAAMINSIGFENTEEYIQRTIALEDIKDRFDVIVNFWREKGELYEKILLLGFDMYRNTDIKEWKRVYEIFAERYISGMAERLNISRQFSRCIFIYFLGLAFHAIATNDIEEYNKEIDFLDIIFRPLIVDAHEDIDKASEEFKKIYKTFLANKDMEKTSRQFKKVFRTLFASLPVVERETAAKPSKKAKSVQPEKKNQGAKTKPKKLILKKSHKKQ